MRLPRRDAPLEAPKLAKAPVAFFRIPTDQVVPARLLDSNIRPIVGIIPSRVLLIHQGRARP